MQDTFLQQLYKSHREAPPSPPPDWVDNWIIDLLALLFPALNNNRFNNFREVTLCYNDLAYRLSQILSFIKLDQPCDVKPSWASQLISKKKAMIYKS